MGPPPENRPPTPVTAMLLESDAGDGVVVVRCLVRSLLDQGVIDAFSARLRELADRLGTGAGVVFNLAGIEFLASAALLALLIFQRTVEGRGGAVETCEAEGWVAELFRVAARSRWAPHPTEAEAVLAVRRALATRRGGGPSPSRSR